MVQLIVRFFTCTWFGQQLSGFGRDETKHLHTDFRLEQTKRKYVLNLSLHIDRTPCLSQGRAWILHNIWQLIALLLQCLPDRKTILKAKPPTVYTGSSSTHFVEFMVIRLLSRRHGQPRPPPISPVSSHDCFVGLGHGAGDCPELRRPYLPTVTM